MKLGLLGILATCLCLSACSDDALRGRVVKVADGDTITVLDSANTQHKIRLQGNRILLEKAAMEYQSRCSKQESEAMDAL